LTIDVNGNSFLRTDFDASATSIAKIGPRRTQYPDSGVKPLLPGNGEVPLLGWPGGKDLGTADLEALLAAQGVIHGVVTLFLIDSYLHCHLVSPFYHKSLATGISILGTISMASLGQALRHRPQPKHIVRSISTLSAILE